jgi:hypothetical protein
MKPLMRALLFLSCLIAQGALADDSLVAHWRLDEESGSVAHDSSGRSSDGQLINGPVWAQGGGVRFDGSNDYIEVGNPLALRLTSSMTLAVWIFAERIRTDTDHFISKSAAAADVGWFLHLEGGYPGTQNRAAQYQ